MPQQTSQIHSYTALNTHLLTTAADTNQIRAKVKSCCFCQGQEIVYLKHDPGHRVTSAATAHKMGGVRFAQHLMDEEMQELDLSQARKAEVLTSVMGKDPKEFLAGHSRRLAQATEQIKALHAQIGDKAAELVSCANSNGLDFDATGTAHLRHAAELINRQAGLSAKQGYEHGALFAKLKAQLSEQRAAELVGAVAAEGIAESASEIDDAVALLQAMPTMPGAEGLQMARDPFYKAFTTALIPSKAVALAQEMRAQDVSYEQADLRGSDMSKVVGHAVRNMKVNPQLSAGVAFRNGCRYVGVDRTPASLEAVREPRERADGKERKMAHVEARREPAQLRIHATRTPPQRATTGSSQHAPTSGVMTPQKRLQPTQSRSVNH